jgi:hypothetical protein
MKKESHLEDLKKDYEKLMKQYNLPSFKDLNEAFDIEKVAESETDCLLREIRKAMMDKVIAYLRFVEMLVNPSNAPLFFMILLKGMGASDKKELEEIYESLGGCEIEVVSLDCSYNEKNEAQFIIMMYKKWKEVSSRISGLTESLRKNWNKGSSKTERGYFG